MHRFRVTAAAVALAAALAGCDDVPFAPRWDGDWNVPLPTDSIYLSSGFPVGIPIPPGTSANVSFPPLQQSMDESIGQLFERPIRTVSAILTIGKSATLTFAADDTLFVAASQADLTNPAATRIIVPIVVAAAATSVTDTVPIGNAQIQMLQAVSAVQGDLWIQLRGRATYQGAAPYTVQSGDAIAVQVRLLMRIGISTRVTN